MEKLIIIKLGGSVITDKAKPFYAKEKVIARLGREISQAQKHFKGKTYHRPRQRLIELRWP